jgi:hypothetical protein
MKTPKGKCPSCRHRLNEKHPAAHAAYVLAHRKAVRKLQKKYAKSVEQCRYCGGKVDAYKGMCNKHALQKRIRNRKIGGYKPWTGKTGGTRPYIKAGL